MMSDGPVMGCDTHLDSFTAAVVDPLGRTLTTETFPNTVRGWAEAIRLCHGYGVTRVGVEAASGYGRCLSQALSIADGVEVLEVPTRLTATHRRRDGASKSDAGDAAAAARAVAAGEGTPWTDHKTLEALRVVVHQRKALVRAQNRAINQLRALLIEVDPERAATLKRLNSIKRISALTTIDYNNDIHQRTISAVIGDLAHECVDRLKRINQHTRTLQELLPPMGWRLVNEIVGCGTVTAATILAEIAGTDGCPTDAHFASLAGAAPLDASSGRQQRHRLNRGGNRQLNSALHTIITTQRRYHSQAHTYISQRAHPGDTMSERHAVRALKRHIARHVWRIIRTDLT